MLLTRKITLLASGCLTILVAYVIFKKTFRKPAAQICSNRTAPYDDHRATLLRRLRKALVPPNYSGQYHLSRPNQMYFSQLGQDKYIDLIMKKKRNGTFIEVGAYNGEHLSNTLFLERNRGWRGLLIEPQPHLYKDMLKKGRRSWLLNGCLGSKSNQIETLNLSMGSSPFLNFVSGMGKVHRLVSAKSFTRTVPVTCYPFGMIMEVLGWSHIDYFSLDVEGAEASVLFSIPFDKISFDIIDLECGYCVNSKGETIIKQEDILQDRYFIKRLLAFHGYKEYHYMGVSDIFYKGPNMSKP